MSLKKEFAENCVNNLVLPANSLTIAKKLKKKEYNKKN